MYQEKSIAYYQRRCCDRSRRPPRYRGEGSVEAMDTTFSPERDLPRTLRANIGQNDSNLHIVDGGKEQTVASGRIDIPARIKME